MPYKKYLRLTRQRVRKWHWLSDTPAMLCWAVIMGVLGAWVVQLFYEGIHLIQRVVTGQSGGITQVTRALSWDMRLLFPTLGGLAAGVLLWLAGRKKASTASDYMEAVVIGDGRMSLRQGLLRSLSSLCTVASGGAIGREGAMIHLSSLAASLFGRFIFIKPERLRLLVACGAAAGVAAAYGAPLAGAIFVAEIVLGSMSIHTLGPLLIASATANITMRLSGHYQAPYQMLDLSGSIGWEIILFVVLGIMIGVVAPGFLKLLNLMKRVFVRSGLPLVARLTVGGFMLGLLLIMIPDVAGNGYSVVRSFLFDSWSWYAIVLMLFAKVFATTITVGSGAVGGVFTPALFVGAAVGTLFGQLVHGIFPALTIDMAIYTLVGMGAFLGAATSAPLMAILMLFEMTLSYQLVLPLIIAAVTAYFMSRTLAEVAMYDVTLNRERDQLLRFTLRNTKLSELVRPADTVLATTATVADALQMFFDYPVRFIYVVDEKNYYLGVIAQPELMRLVLNHNDVKEQPIGELLQLDYVKTLTPDMRLDQAQAQFVDFVGERLPVVRSVAEPRLIGVVYKSALLEKYSALKRSLDATSEALISLNR